jgi:hypothetical protein
VADFLETEPETSTLALSAEVRGNFAALPLSLGQRNWAPPITIWPAGETSVPAYYRVTGAGAIVTRRSTPGTPYQGNTSVEVTSGGAAAGVFERRIIQAADWAAFAFLEGLDFSAMVPVWTESPTAVRVGLFDGVDTIYSAYHTGGGEWELLPVKRIVGSGGTPTELTLRCEANVDVIARYGQPCIRPGPVRPGFWTPAEMEERTMQWTWAGVLAVGDDALGHFPSPGLPCIVTGAHLYAGTAPTDADIEVQFAKNGADDMFATAPAIAASANSGSQAVDGATYANRCLALNDRVHLDVDQVGSSVAGSDVNAYLRFLAPVLPTQPWVTFGTVE